MLKRIASITIAALVAGSAFAAAHYQPTEAGIIVTPTDKNCAPVRVKVIDDRTVRISAEPDGKFDNAAPSLVVLNPSASDNFAIKDEGNRAVLSTPRLNVAVNYTDGQVTFYDANGALLLAENPNGRSFSKISVEGTDAYTVAQTFASPDDKEGIYGLGQHQADEFNYKGKNEELFQYNTKVSVPFVVSTGNYGVLWDSYSLCRFGNPTDYLQLGEAFKLYDKDGKKGALTGTYTDAKGNTLARREPNVYFEHLERGNLGHVINLPEDFNFYGSKVVYEGEIEADETGIYDFIMYYSGYQTIWLDGKEVVPERWRTAWNPNSYKFSAPLTKGKRTPIRIEWEPNGSVAYCGLRAYKPITDNTRNQMRWWGEMQDMIDYYFIAGSSMDDVIKGYRSLTGKCPVMPKWAMGYWQSREKYNTSDEVLSTIAEYRKRHIPLDNIVIDWLHWPEDSWGCHEFDRKRFPDPKGMVDSIHDSHAKVMISVWPKFYETTEHFKEFDKKGWMYRQAITDSIRDWVGPGYMGSFYDAYSPEARKLFWGQMRDHYYPLGFDAWWMDASEPNIRDCTDIQYRKDLCGPTALGPSAKYFNAYALMNAEAIYNGQRGVNPDKRVFLLTRSGFAGQQRYSTATWSGDIATRWEDMKAQISAGLNFAMSGVPYWTMDIGGFCVEDRYVAAQRLYEKTGQVNDDLKEWRELNTRWFQFGAFAPLYRAHGQWPLREIYNLAPEGDPAYESMTYYTRLRYRLMPYIYSLAGATYFDDATIMRPMVMDFTADVVTKDISDQFMMGKAIMAAPVTTYGARERKVYFPQGSMWYDFYTGKKTNGGQFAVVDAPYERMPLYVRSGSILPTGPDMEWCNEKPTDKLNIYVFAGEDGDFVMYEDEGDNYNYEKGKYCRIPMHWDDAKRTLTIGDCEGSYPGMAQQRTLNVVLVDGTKNQAISESADGKKIQYEGKKISMTL